MDAQHDHDRWWVRRRETLNSDRKRKGAAGNQLLDFHRRPHRASGRMEPTLVPLSQAAKATLANQTMKSAGIIV
jgi:hypothetical protein